MKPQLFLDLDGVFADFDGHYEKLFGVRPNQDTYEPKGLWDNVRRHGNFYGTMPLMKDAKSLFDSCVQLHRNPIFLTGVPYSIPGAKEQKIAWVRQHFGPKYKTICCRSQDKCLYGKRGDVLLDDRMKYANYWINMGGYFVLHLGADTSITALSTYYMRQPAW